jgi:hypothetical protein
MGSPMNDKPIVRLTRFVGSGTKPRKKSGGTLHQVVYGVDEDGNERVYVVLETEEDLKAWRASNPLWREMQSQVIGTLFNNPATRDLDLRVNIQGALDQRIRRQRQNWLRHSPPRG